MTTPIHLGAAPRADLPDLVDAHHHVWDLGVRDQDWITGPDLAPLRRNFDSAELATQARPLGVRSTVVVQTVTVAEETPELLALADRDPLVGAVVGWTDLTAPEIADHLAALRALPGGARLAGIRHQVQHEDDPRWLCRPEVLRSLAAVAAAGLVYDLVIVPEQLPAATEAAEAVPQLTFVLDHLGKPPVAHGALQPWARELRRFAALPNTVGKLSGLVTEADWDSWTVADLRPYAEVALEAFGPARVMFGSDWPVCRLATSGYAEVLDTARALAEGLEPAERRAVFADTARRVYGLN